MENHSKNGEDTWKMSASKSWSNTYGSTDSQQSRVLLSATPITEPDQELKLEPESTPLSSVSPLYPNQENALSEESIPELENLALVDSRQRQESGPMTHQTRAKNEHHGPKHFVLNLKINRI